MVVYKSSRRVMRDISLISSLRAKAYISLTGDTKIYQSIILHLHSTYTQNFSGCFTIQLICSLDN